MFKEFSLSIYFISSIFCFSYLDCFIPIIVNDAKNRAVNIQRLVGDNETDTCPGSLAVNCGWQEVNMEFWGSIVFSIYLLLMFAIFIWVVFSSYEIIFLNNFCFKSNVYSQVLLKWRMKQYRAFLSVKQ